MKRERNLDGQRLEMIYYRLRRQGRMLAYNPGLVTSRNDDVVV